ncbi:MAG: hypothetical protein Q7R81_05495 [Candidatus Peregrinibacteria bacterium]|nr:hypothetical protein [Candidatus Peregrinibacteria bacterium]
MTVRATTSPSKSLIGQQLHKRILLLSADPKPEVILPLDATEDLVARERLRAEEEFQDALCARTWWRLTPEERSIFREEIRRKNEHYREHPESAGLDYACQKEIRRLLAVSWHIQPLRGRIGTV